MNFEMLKDVEPETPHGASSPSPGEVPEATQGGTDDTDVSGEETEFITEERKPLNRSALMLFVILAIGGAGTYFMYWRTGPATAQAADPAIVSAEATIADFMKGGRNNIALLHKLLEATARIVEQFKDYTNVIQVPLSDLKANPFHFAWFKPAAGEDPEEIAKKKREEQRAAVLKAAQALQLQSVVIRANKKACLISNTLYQEGEAVDGFVIEKISPDTVVVRKDAYRIELKMTK
jgi:hypothetical protein